MEEDRNATLRRKLWSFSQFVEMQRRILEERREKVLTGEKKPELLRSLFPDRFENARRLLGLPSLIDLERRLVLHALDHCWMDHLAAVVDLMDGIHLVQVGGLSPLEEFQKAVIESFERCFDTMEDRVAAKFDTLKFSANGVDLDDAGLRGPTSTWTYLVDEHSLEDRIASALIGQRNIGFAAGAALSGTLLLFWALLRRFRLRKR